MTEINNPKKYCNDSQSGSQQLPPNLCNCTPNIIAGPNIIITTNPDGSSTISAVVADTDTILNNPHFGAGAPAGYSRLYYDLYNKLTNTTITADYTYVDLPEDVITNISGNNYTNEAGAVQPIVQTVVNTLSGSNLTTTVNGVASTPVDLCPVVSDCETVTTISGNLYYNEDGATSNVVNTNVLDSLANVMTSTVNGIADTAPIINSNALTLDGSNNLVSTVNGVPSTLSICPAVVACETDLTLTSPTNTILITPGGTNGHAPTTDVNISSAAGNSVINNSGIYSPQQQVVQAQGDGYNATVVQLDTSGASIICAQTSVASVTAPIWSQVAAKWNFNGAIGVSLQPGTLLDVYLDVRENGGAWIPIRNNSVLYFSTAFQGVLPLTTGFVISGIKPAGSTTTFEARLRIEVVIGAAGSFAFFGDVHVHVEAITTI